MTPSVSQDDIQIKLADCRYKIFASNEYISKNGYPKTSTDLDNHKIISYGEDAQPPLDRHRLNWLLTIGKENKRPRKPILEVSSIYGIAKATEVGMGIASLPDWMEFEMIELTEILSQLEGPKMSISLCFNYELRNDSRIKAFKDFMINSDIAKVSLVGVGMRTHAGIASKAFKALSENDVNIQIISTSEIKITMVIDKSLVEKAVQVLHEEFELDK